MLPQLRKLEHEFADALVVIGVHSAKFPAERIGANLRKAVLRNDLHHPVVNDADFVNGVYDIHFLESYLKR